MNLNEGRKKVQELFAQALVELGFQEQKRLTFTRGDGDRKEIIAFSVRVASGGRICFSVGVGVRFDQLETHLGALRDQELFYTVGKPLHLLSEDMGFREWCIDGATAPSVATDVVDLIKQRGMPFFEQYRQLKDVERALESDRPSDWFTLTPKERRQMLTAIQGLPK